MTKTRQRHPQQYEKYWVGCMWGVLSMLNFRNRSNQRFLSDEKSELMNNAAAGDSGNRFEGLATIDKNLQTTLNGKDRSVVKCINSKPSVKKLIEEEVVGEQDLKIKKGDVKLSPRVSEKAVEDDSKKKWKKNRRSSEGSRDFEFDFLNVSEALHDDDERTDKHYPKVIVEHIFDEICRKSILSGEKDGMPDSVDSRTSDIKEKLGETIREFINQQLASGKHLGADETTLFSKELVNVLQVPNLDEQSFIKHLRNPNSILMTYMQSLQNINLDGDKISELQQELDKSDGIEAFLNDNSRSFKRDVDSQEEKGSKRSEKSSSRIIILKPGPTEEEKLSITGILDSSSLHIARSNQKSKTNAPFSVASIKRKLKNVMGRERWGVSPGGIIKKIPDQWGSDKANVGDSSGSSPGKEHFYVEKMAKLSPGTKRIDKFIKPEELRSHIQRETMNDSKRREAYIYLEAKKHLIEMLSTTDEIKNFSSRQFPKSLGRILSLSDYNSPLPSPGTEIDHNFVTAQMRFTSRNSPEQTVGEAATPRKEVNDDIQIHPSTESTPNELVILEKCDSSLDTKLGELSGIGELEEVSDPCQDTPVVEGEGDILQTSDDNAKEFFDADVEITISYDNQTDDNNESFTTGCNECPIEEHGCSDRSVASPSTSPRRSLTAKKEDDFRIVIDRLERPSPISVLDPSLVEDDISPAKTSPRADFSVEIRIQPLQINFDDEMPSPLLDRQTKPGFEDHSLVEYVKAVLQASSLNWSEHYLRSDHPDQLIDPSLFDRVDFLLDHLQFDQKLMFDCINEVLLEVCKEHFGSCPCVAFVKPGIRPALNQASALRKVWEGIRWHLLPLPLPRTLDLIVRKDIAKSGNWMDLCFNAEIIGFEMGDLIFEELIEETIIISLTFADISKIEDFS